MPLPLGKSFAIQMDFFPLGGEGKNKPRVKIKCCEICSMYVVPIFAMVFGFYSLEIFCRCVL